MSAQSVPVFVLVLCVVAACGMAAWAMWDRARALRTCAESYERTAQAIATAERATLAAQHWRNHALRDRPRKPALTMSAPIYHAPFASSDEHTPVAPPSYPAPALTGLPRFRLTALDGSVDPDGVHRPPPLPEQGKWAALDERFPLKP